MKIIVLSPLIYPGAVISADYMARWSATIRGALGQDTQIHILTKLNNAPPAGETIGVEVFHCSGQTRTELIQEHLRGRDFDIALRLPLDAPLDPAMLRDMKTRLEESPEALVFTDYTRNGSLVSDAFTRTLFEKTRAFEWINSSNMRLENYNLRIEYYNIATIPRTVPCLAVGPDREELEQIIDVRIWFNPVRIRNRVTYYTKEFDFLLDQALLMPSFEVFKDRTVLEVACWEGALGSQALDAGARSVHFTDCPMRAFDWRYPFPMDSLGKEPNYDKTVGEAIGSLPLVLANRDPEKVSFSQAEAYELERDLGGRTFDVTICGGLLYHLYDPMRAIQQVCRVTHRTVVVGTWIQEGREPAAYLQEPLESDRYDTTTWFYMTYPMIKALFAHNGFERGALLGGNHPLGDNRNARHYRYMIFERTRPMTGR